MLRDMRFRTCAAVSINRSGYRSLSFRYCPFSNVSVRSMVSCITAITQNPRDRLSTPREAAGTRRLHKSRRLWPGPEELGERVEQYHRSARVGPVEGVPRSPAVLGLGVDAEGLRHDALECDVGREVKERDRHDVKTSRPHVSRADLLREIRQEVGLAGAILPDDKSAEARVPDQGLADCSKVLPGIGGGEVGIADPCRVGPIQMLELDHRGMGADIDDISDSRGRQGVWLRARKRIGGGAP